MEGFDEFQLRAFQWSGEPIYITCKESHNGLLIENTTDHTGLMIWAGTYALCDYINSQQDEFTDLSVLELGSGAGVVGILLSRLCKQCVLTDGNEQIVELLKRNIAQNQSRGTAQVLQWGSLEQIEKLPSFDLIFGSDIIYPAISEALLTQLFETVSLLLIKKEATFFIISFVVRDAKQTTSRLLTIASQFSFKGEIIPWESYSDSEPLMGAKIIRFCLAGSESEAWAVNKNMGQEIRADLWDDELLSSEENWEPPFEGDEML